MRVLRIVGWTLYGMFVALGFWIFFLAPDGMNKFMWGAG